ncbi:MAG: sugar nucleotide-binding protein [Rhodospirillales bacterium]|nr:sugar nucleotide-binding protein [Rhodospirillales bacterium]
MKIAVLGATGMLGSQVLKTLEEGHSHQLTATNRNGHVVHSSSGSSTKIVDLDAGSIDARSIVDLIGDCDWWINCIGVIKPYIHDDNPIEIARAIAINSLFPAILTQAADDSKSRLIQISTDCVWDGADGRYSELDHHNAADVYGKSKSLGEVRSNYSHIIRCSIIGRELRGKASLLDWFLSQEQSATLQGFSNHHWNGITTLQFAKICKGIIEQNVTLKPLQHLVPRDQVSKHELLNLFAQYFRRQDITMTPFATEVPINRTISTVDQGHNEKLWLCGDYPCPPSIEESIAELASDQAT